MTATDIDIARLRELHEKATPSNTASDAAKPDDKTAERAFVIPIPCWRPDPNSDKPYDRHRFPPGCPDRDYCRNNGACFWRCEEDEESYE